MYITGEKKIMTRIHGDKKLSRRTNIEHKNNYRDYEKDLRIDFQDTCGYCGKIVEVSKSDFEIDHFVPKSLAKSKINNYNNLVYSCKQCNRKKSNKWPTQDINISHNEKEGFIDPVLEEYDEHLERTVNGDIIGKTELGNYMVKAFAFNKRPMQEIWKLVKLSQERDRLLKADSNNSESFKCWQEVALQIEDLLKFMFDNKE